MRLRDRSSVLRQPTLSGPSLVRGATAQQQEIHSIIAMHYTYGTYKVITPQLLPHTPTKDPLVH